MKKIIVFIVIVVLILSVFFIFDFTTYPVSVDEDRMTVAEAMGNSDTSGYTRANRPREFEFPKDHGAHQDFKTEWWYFTGNLTTSSDQRFGYQFTIFRSALTPTEISYSDAWATNQIFMGHFAISDIDNNTFHFFERFTRGNNRLAGVQTFPFKVWLEDWQVATTNESKNQPIPDFTIESRTEDINLNLELSNLKPVVLQGELGLSQKGPQSGNASYYYSLTRLNTTGTIEIENIQYEVKGLSWLDREWSTSALGENQVGWDWFSLQLDNNIEIMYYQIRQKNDTIDPLSKGSFVFANGEYTKLNKVDLDLAITNYWQSPLGGTYPSGWTMKIPKYDIQLNIEPIMKDQELDVSIRYWEGAVEIDGNYQGTTISGKGYVELTGYAQDRL